MEGRVASLLLLFPLLLVVVVQCQTAPYVSFMGQTLADHFYVNISQVGTGSDRVQCHTDLSTCCTNSQGFRVETGTSLMELDCHTLMVVISLSGVKLRELIFVVTEVLDQLVSIVVIFQLLLFIILLTTICESQCLCGTVHQ